MSADVVLMRPLAALLLSLAAGCGIPYKFQVAQWPQQNSEVIWVYHADGLYRCALYAPMTPLCIEARYFSGPPSALASHPSTTAPVPVPELEPAPKKHKPPVDDEGTAQ